MRDYDIIIESCHTPVREMVAPCNPPEYNVQLAERVRLAREYGKAHTSVELSDDAAYRTMEVVARRMALTNGEYQKVLRVARVIANLGASPKLQAKHIAEAAQYSGFGFRAERMADEKAA